MHGNIIASRSRRNTRYAPVPRGLLTIPLARDRRTKFKCRTCKAGLYVNLPGNERVQLWFDHGATPRLITGTDIDVLAKIIALMSVTETWMIEHATFSALLRDLDYGVSARNRLLVKSALGLWSNVSLFYDECWLSKTLLLPPPFACKGRTITLHKAWRKVVRKQYERINLPLPHDAAEQNLYLRGYFFHRRDRTHHDFRFKTRRQNDEKGGFVTTPHKIVNLMRSLGVSHKNYRKRLSDLASRVDRHYAKHGGCMVVETGEAVRLNTTQCLFYIEPMRLRR